MVMELVSGRTLRQVLDDGGALPPAEAIRVATAVCEALEAAHAAGIVHRDIKPAHIVLSGREVKVLDDPGPPSARRPGLSAKIDLLTASLLAKVPGDRPVGAVGARAALAAVL